MALKDIVLCLDPTDAGERRLRLAAAIARGCGAHLSSAFVLPEGIPGAPPFSGFTIPPSGLAWMPQVGVAGEGVTSDTAPQLRTDITRGAELVDIIEQRFRAELRPDGIDGEWLTYGSGEAEDLIRSLAAYDLVIYGQTVPDYRLPTGYRPEEIIVGAGRPTLVVPYAGEFETVGTRVIVAWDGSREASRALHGALPLMRAAKPVIVMSVHNDGSDIEEDRPGLERVVRHLGRHGLSAKVEDTTRGDLPIGDVLLSRAADLDADLIVAGAYHHSRFREALLGGASRDLLDHMTVPVLMAH